MKGIGFGAFVTQKGMGYEFSLTTGVLMDYIPAEIHGHGTYTSIGALSKRFLGMHLKKEFIILQHMVKAWRC